MERRSLLLALVLGVGCGDGDPASPDLSEAELVLVRGDGQRAAPGEAVPMPLQVRAQHGATGRAVAGARVRWEVVEGEGARLQPRSAPTDSAGMVSTRLTLGPNPGRYRVRARLGNSGASPVDFLAFASPLPDLEGLSSPVVQAGDTLGLQGRNFSPRPEANRVSFSGVPGRVVSASTGELRVEVPPCLLARTVEVRVQVGERKSPPLSLTVAGGTRSHSLQRGEDLLLGGSQEPWCLHLPSLPGTSYLVVPHSSGTVPGGSYPFRLVGLTADGTTPAAISAAGASGSPLPAAAAVGRGEGLSPQGAWDRRVRLLERRLLEEGDLSRSSAAPPVRAPSGEGMSLQPTPGERRAFWVLNRKEEFDKVNAILRWVGARILIYVDERAPAQGYTSADLNALAQEFDDPIHPVVTQAFGAESDLDGNGRIVLLLTPAVNRLTEGDGSQGYVAGFFYGLDLLKDRKGSNQGEILYGLVPDPTGKEGPVLSRSQVMSLLPGVLAHEFQHMVHFNQKILAGGARSPETLWLSEALAQMAEELVGAAFQARFRPDKALEYRLGNWSRARRFLQNPSQVSVLATLSPGTLAERGAGWLLLQQISGLPGQEGILGRLTRSPRTGVENLVHETGQTWRLLISQWAASLYLDGLPVPVRPELRVAGLNLREALSRFDGSYPLRARPAGESSFALVGTLWSSAPDYLIISPPASGGVTLALTGLEGRPPEWVAGFQLMVVRLQ